MKKFLLTAIVALLAVASHAQIGTLRPIEQGIDVNHLPDGKYSVSFDPMKVTSTARGYYIDFDIYVVDEYKASDLKKLAAGDRIVTGHGTVAVESVKFDDSDKCYTINEEGQYLFFAPGKNGNYVNVGPNDLLCQTNKGTTRLLVPITLKFTDDGINGNPLAKTKTVSGKRLGKYLRSSWSNEFCEFNTGIVIKRGKIVRFYRTYMP